MKNISKQLLYDKIYQFLKDNEIMNVSFNVTDLTTQYHSTFTIEPCTRKNEKLEGMQIIYEDGTFEVSEYQAGEKENELHIYKETPFLITALKDLLKGNKRKPIKVWY